MVKFGRRGATAAALVALALIGGACGSSSKSSSGPTSTGSAPTSPGSSPSGSSGAATGAPLKVGLICTCSGAFGSDTTPAGDVIRAWVDSVQASGGIDGHPVQLSFSDDAGNPGTSSSDAQTMISNHVDVILDESILDSAWASAVQSAGIPVIGGSFTSEPYYQNPDFYPSGQTDDSITQSIVAVAKLAGAANIGIMYCAEAPQCQQTVPLIKSAAAAKGLSLVYQGSVSATAPNYTAQCVAAQQAHVSGLFIANSPQIIAKIGADCSRQGYDPIYLTEGTSFGGQEYTATGIEKNLWSPMPTLPFTSNTPALQQMNTVVDKYYPGLRQNANSWSEYAAQAWTGAMLLQTALKAGGLTASDTPSAAEIVKGLEALHNETLGGLSPPLTFTPGKPHPVDCWFTVHVQDGKPTNANGGKLSCESSS